MNSNNKLLNEFIDSSQEHLQNLNENLISLEKEPTEVTHLNIIAGAIHSIKGNAGFLSLNHLYEFLHISENILQTIRELPPFFCPPKVIDIMFQVMDTVEAILRRLQSGENDFVDWLPKLIKDLVDLEGKIETQEKNKKFQKEKALPISPQISNTHKNFEVKTIVTVLQKELNLNSAKFLENIIQLLKENHEQALKISLENIETLNHFELKQLIKAYKLGNKQIQFVTKPENRASLIHLWQVWGLEKAEEIFVKS